MMILIKKGLTTSVFAALTLLLTGCQNDDKTIKIGTIAGPEAEIAQVAADVAEKRYGLHVKIVTFTDYLQPNTALNDGQLQANAFQHEPYLNEQIAAHHYNITVIGKTFVYPMGIYSAHYHSLADVPEDSQVAIPNDPTNQGRAFLLLQKAGLITLAPAAGLNATPQDVTDNPKKLQFVELDAAQLARAYQDIAVAVINTNYAIPAGLLPSRDALFTEDKHSPYANLIVIRTQDVNKPWVNELLDSFHSQAVVDKAEALFEGQTEAAFTVTPDTASTTGK
ncbi:MAG: MetQ/NlpA family ABC transporter substrate-binding protein [Gammaproteobacteria bacterium]|nr:MetQ/NlpA family ABC transporter substrate-binding protein [Gammaproteobacteria bacterium]